MKEDIDELVSDYDEEDEEDGGIFKIRYVMNYEL